MGTSLRTEPKLMRVSVVNGESKPDLDGKYTLWREAQWLVERQHLELQRVRKELEKQKALSQKYYQKLNSTKGELNCEQHRNE